MKTILIASQKGGSGKSTAAVHLAVCAIRNKQKTVLLDIDPQGSAFKWNESRPDEIKLDAAQVQAAQLSGVLKIAEENGANVVIIDSSPRSDSDAAISLRSADFVLIPCRPARFDLEAVEGTVEILKLARVPFAVLLSIASRGKIVQEARDFFERKGVRVFETVVYHRVAYSHALIDGSSVHEFEPGGKAASEIDALYAEVNKAMAPRRKPRMRREEVAHG